MGSVKETTYTDSLKPDEMQKYVDPAYYINSHKEYHDCVCVVGTDENKTERIGAVKCYLISQSSVFRDKIMDYETEVRITDVSPEIFKLILTHVYRGKLPAMEQGTVAQLALAACIYKIYPLLAKASKMVVPKSAEDVYPALVCVSNMDCPNLVPHVTRIIQQETAAVLNSDRFLDLDAKCVEYICRQEKLSVAEPELWRALVRWVDKRVTVEPNKSKRQHLQQILPYVRLTTFTPAEIGQDKGLTQILDSEEVLKLLCAVSNNVPWEMHGICSMLEKREAPDANQKDDTDPPPDEGAIKPEAKNNIVFDVCKDVEINVMESNKISNLTINTQQQDVEIVAFYLETNPINNLGNQAVYSLRCTATICKIEEGFCKERFVVEFGGMVIGSSLIPFQLKLRNDQPLILQANSIYNFTLELNMPHPVYRMPSEIQDSPVVCPDYTIKYNTPFHVKKVSYYVQNSV